MEHSKYYLARLYPISLQGKYLLRGWYLIRNKDGEEWLMRRHFALSFRRFLPLYQTTIPLEEYIYQKENKSGTVATATFLGIVFAAFVRNFIPKEWLIGAINSPFSLSQALINIVIVSLVTILSIVALTFTRDFRLRLFLKRRNVELRKVGKIRSAEPLRRTPSGKEYW